MSFASSTIFFFDRFPLFEAGFRPGSLHGISVSRFLLTRREGLSGLDQDGLRHAPHRGVCPCAMGRRTLLSPFLLSSALVTFSSSRPLARLERPTWTVTSGPCPSQPRQTFVRGVGEAEPTQSVPPVKRLAPLSFRPALARRRGPRPLLLPAPAVELSLLSARGPNLHPPPSLSSTRPRSRPETAKRRHLPRARTRSRAPARSPGAM